MNFVGRQASSAAATIQSQMPSQQPTATMKQPPDHTCTHAGSLAGGGEGGGGGGGGGAAADLPPSRGCERKVVEDDKQPVQTDSSSGGYTDGQPRKRRRAHSVAGSTGCRRMYVTMMQYLDPAVLAEAIGDHWEHQSIEDAVAVGSTDALFMDGSAFFDRRTYGSALKCGIKSRVDDPTKVLHKFNLHELLMSDEKGRRAIPPCILIDTARSR